MGHSDEEFQCGFFRDICDLQVLYDYGFLWWHNQRGYGRFLLFSVICGFIFLVFVFVLRDEKQPVWVDFQLFCFGFVA